MQVYLKGTNTKKLNIYIYICKHTRAHPACKVKIKYHKYYAFISFAHSS